MAEREGWTIFTLPLDEPVRTARVFVVPTRELHSHYVSIADPVMCPCAPTVDEYGAVVHHVYLN